MKKIIVLLIAAVALTVSASAQKRETVPYAGVSFLTTFEEFGGGASFGFRNYNRNAFVSVGVGAEAFGYIIPASREWGAFAAPEIGVAIGPKWFKFYPHTGVMFGYSSQATGFGWGGKNGTAFDFGKCFTLDFSVMTPSYNFSEKNSTYAVSLIFRFGKK